MGAVVFRMRGLGLIASCVLMLVLAPVLFGGFWAGYAWADKLPAPADASVSIEGGAGQQAPSVRLSWGSVSGAQSYEVTVEKYGGFYTKDFTAEVPATSGSMVSVTLDEGSTDGKIYTWTRVRMSVVAKASGQDTSDVLYFKTGGSQEIDIPHPAIPTTCPSNVVVESTGTGLMLTWKNNLCDTAAYVGVYRRPGTSGTFERLEDTGILSATTSWIDYDVTEGVQYQYRLAYLTAEGKNTNVKTNVGDSSGEGVAYTTSSTVTFSRNAVPSVSIDLSAFQPQFGAPPAYGPACEASYDVYNESWEEADGSTVDDDNPFRPGTSYFYLFRLDPDLDHNFKFDEAATNVSVKADWADFEPEVVFVDGGMFTSIFVTVAYTTPSLDEGEYVVDLTQGSAKVSAANQAAFINGCSVALALPDAADYTLDLNADGVDDVQFTKGASGVTIAPLAGRSNIGELTLEPNAARLAAVQQTGEHYFGTITFVFPRLEAFEQLEAAVNAAQALDKSVYTSQTFKRLANALAQARIVLESTSATGADALDALAELQDAQGKLVLQEVADAQDDLNVTLANVDALQEQDYTPATWAVLQSAVDAARELLVNPAATAAELKEADQSVADALAQLEDLLFRKAADELEGALDAAAGLKEKDYTAGTWKKLVQARSEAQQLLDDPSATPWALQAAANKVAEAASALERDCAAAIKATKVTGVKVKAGKKKATASWKKAKVAGKTVHYQIQYKQAGKKTKKTTTTTSLKKTVKKLAKGKKYNFKVRAYITLNGKQVYGAWSKTAKSAKIK